MRSVLYLAFMCSCTAVFAETSVTQIISTDGNISVNGSSDSIVGQQVIILDGSTDGISSQNVTSVNNCGNFHLVAKSDGKGKVKISYSGVSDIISALSVVYPNGDTKSLLDSGLKYKLVESTIKIYSDTEAVDEIILQVKNGESINSLSIPFHEESKFVQICSDSGFATVNEE